MKRTPNRLRPFPSVVKGGCIVYKVVGVQNNDADGHVDVRQQEVVLDVDQGQDSACGVLAHECIHVMFNASGLENLTDAEELAAGILGAQLPLFIRDNPDVIVFLRNPQAFERLTPSRVLPLPQEECGEDTPDSEEG